MNFQYSVFSSKKTKPGFEKPLKLKTIHRGFTLIEALIVMVILASSMTAALYLLSTVVFSTQKNLARTKAVYLAQECSELTRNLRDTAWLNYQAWDCAFGSAGDEFVIANDHTNNQAISTCNNLKTGVTLQPVLTPGQTQLYQTGALINHDSTGDTLPYTRRLQQVSQTDTDADGRVDTIDFNCLVEWQFNGVNQQVNLPQTLTNWRKN